MQMLEVPHNWSLGLRRSLVALLGTVAAGLFKPAELHEHLKKIFCQNDIGRMGMGYDFDF